MKDLKNREINDVEDVDIRDDKPEEFESSFKYKAVPLDKLETLDENGTAFSIKELMDIDELKEELDR